MKKSAARLMEESPAFGMLGAENTSVSVVVFPPYKGIQGKGGFPGSLSLVMVMQILIAEGHARVRHALSVLLQEQTGWTVVGTAGSLEELAQKLQSSRPDILLLDWELPGGPLDRVVIVLQRCFPDLALVVMSTRPEVLQQVRELDIGMSFSKADSPERLLGLIRSRFVPPKQSLPGRELAGQAR